MLSIKKIAISMIEKIIMVNGGGQIDIIRSYSPSAILSVAIKFIKCSAGEVNIRNYNL